METLSSILAPESKPKLMRNETRDGKPLITPFLQADGVTPKTDLQMRPIGSIMIAQEKPTMNGGFLNVSVRYAFLSATVETLENIISRNKLTHGSELPGQIIVHESLEPFFKGQKPKQNPTTKAVIEIDVKGTLYPVFYQTIYTEDMKAKDKTIRSVEDAINWLDRRSIKAAAGEAGAATLETSGIPNAEPAKVA